MVLKQKNNERGKVMTKKKRTRLLSDEGQSCLICALFFALGFLGLFWVHESPNEMLYVLGWAFIAFAVLSIVVFFFLCHKEQKNKREDWILANLARKVK